MLWASRIWTRVCRNVIRPTVATCTVRVNTFTRWRTHCLTLPSIEIIASIFAVAMTFWKISNRITVWASGYGAHCIKTDDQYAKEHNDFLEIQKNFGSIYLFSITNLLKHFLKIFFSIQEYCFAKKEHLLEKVFKILYHIFFHRQQPV